MSIIDGNEPAVNPGTLRAEIRHLIAENEMLRAKCAEINQFAEYVQLALDTLAPYREEGGIAFAVDGWAKRLLQANPGQALLDHVKALDQIASERPGVGEWSHSLGVWCFQGERFGSGAEADYAAFNAHLAWSEKLVQALAACKGNP